MLRLIQLFVFFFSVSSCLSGQELIFRSITTDDGLPAGECFSVHQDHKGYLWICTGSGLAKYNGRTFKIFTTANGLTDNTVFDAYEDEQGRLFYSTSNSRLGYIKNDSAFTLPVTDTLSKLLSYGARFIKSIGNYDKDRLLIATQRGFYTVDKKTLSQLTFLPAPKDILLWTKVIDGKAYCAEYTDLTSYRPMGRANVYTLCIEKEGNKNTLVIGPELITISALSGFKTILLSDGRLLIGFWDKILTIHKDGQLDTIRLPSRLISFYQDHNGGIWFSLFRHGLTYYKTGNFAVTPQQFLSGITTNALHMDMEGGIWVGSESEGLKHCASLSIFSYPDEKILASKLTTLSVLPSCVAVNGQNSVFYTFINKHQFQSHSVFPYDSARGPCAYLYHEDALYITGYNGTYLTDPDFKTFRILAEPDGRLSGMYVLAKGKNGRLWGVNFSDLVYIEQDTIRLVMKLPARGRDLCIDNSGIIYIGTNTGLLRYENEKLMPVKDISCKINRVKCDAEGKIWVCTDGMGLICMSASQIFCRYTYEQGLASDICYDVAFDQGGRIWVATSNGLNNIQPTTKKVCSFQTGQGLLSNEILKLAVWKNELYMATQKGLCVGDIDQLTCSSLSPPVFIDHILVNNQSVKGSDVFDYNANNFTFFIEGISFRNSHSIVYRYRLIGADTTWHTSAGSEITFANLSNGKYVFEAIAVTADGTRSVVPVRFSFTITPPFWKEVWFIVLGLLAGAGLLFGTVNLRIRSIRTKEKQKTELNRMIAEYKMVALRSQMNPHFIFNAINSIQNYVLNNNPQQAYEYLTQFSTLIRKILVNAQQNTITLEKELQMLELYIQLEQRRFRDKFSYRIVVDKQITPEEIKIPVMLLQPFVENAIWHGIMPLEKDKLGKLEIDLVLRNETLFVTIEDNGIGRKRASEMNNNRNHESFGMMLSEKRLEILKAIGHEDFQVIVTDLYNEKHEACGTRVQLILPMKC